MTYALRPTGSEHHVLVITRQLETILIELLDGGWIIGSIVTDGVVRSGKDNFGVTWPKYCFVRCFAHDINNLVKSGVKRVFKVVSEQTVAVVRVLNASP
ncbi:LOW QUALITY PROTEIN: hypothetical protein PHPALM_15282 [Phytophthora palmivora]|uniref:DUF659 domain-containing protein n=1 Tax=Phytophthora palmivora TaxID=4796 RepID=A0A2P4XSL2_9STRA|nr:LOW QUALITY PROTEIN: hypothetical protein PHPALM_15282 [Phytophthora palmivora]